MFNNVIINELHGFRTHKLTSTNLFVYIPDLFGTVEERGQVDAIYTDLSKIFNSVDHVLLINKLKAIGVNGPLLSWFGSFLTGRTQQVKIWDLVSSLFNVYSNVPQNGHISPLLLYKFGLIVKGKFGYFGRRSNNF